jgi:hypothetical protein
MSEKPATYTPGLAIEALQGSAQENKDPWIHRSQHMRCRTCMYFVEKLAAPRGVVSARSDSGGINVTATISIERVLGRCRRHAPTMSGFPAVFDSDWCGDHKLDENKL